MTGSPSSRASIPSRGGRGSSVGTGRARAAAPGCEPWSAPGGCGSMLAVDVAELIAQARRANGIVGFVHQVGDFVFGGRTYCGVWRRRCRRRPDVAERSRRFRAHDRAGPAFAFASWSISRSRRSPRRSTIRRRRCPPSTSCTVCCASSVSANPSARRFATPTGTLPLIFRTPNSEDYVTSLRRDPPVRHGQPAVRAAPACNTGTMRALPRMRHAGLRGNSSSDRAKSSADRFPRT